MSSLRLKIQKATDIWQVRACLSELGALIDLAGERIKELQAEDELDRLIAETMPDELKDLG